MLCKSAPVGLSADGNCFSRGSTCFQLNSSRHGWPSEYKGRGRTSFGLMFPSINCMILETQLRPLSQSINYQHCSVGHVSLAVENWPRLQRAFMLSILDKPQDQTRDFCNSIFNPTVCPASNVGGGGGALLPNDPFFARAGGKGGSQWRLGWGWSTCANGRVLQTLLRLPRLGAVTATTELWEADRHRACLAPGTGSLAGLCAGWEDKGERI